MIPFFTPLAAHDGTTRRPLVERVPECRPDGLRHRDQVHSEPSIGTSTWELSNDPITKWLFGFHPCFSDPVASDLCCMAAIRWLRDQCGRVVKTSPVYGWCAGNEHWEHYETDAHAINDLCHTVADEMGIAP